MNADNFTCPSCYGMACVCSVSPRESKCPADCGHGISSHGRRGCFHKNGHDEYCGCGYVPEHIQDAIRVFVVHVHRCAKHPRYAAKRKPLSNCEGCWKVWAKVKW